MMDMLLSCRLSARRLARNEVGAVAVEFGMVGSLLFFALVMSADLGLAMHHRSQMESSVRAGLQAALGNPEDLQVVEDAALAATDLPNSPAATAAAERQCYCSDGIEVDCDGGTCGALVKERYIELTLTQDHVWLFGVPGLDNPMSISVSRSLRVE